MCVRTLDVLTTQCKLEWVELLTHSPVTHIQNRKDNNDTCKKKELRMAIGQRWNSIFFLIYSFYYKIPLKMYKINVTMFLSNLMLSRECVISGSWDHIRWALSTAVFNKVTKGKTLIQPTQSPVTQRKLSLRRPRCLRAHTGQSVYQRSDNFRKWEHEWSQKVSLLALAVSPYEVTTQGGRKQSNRLEDVITGAYKAMPIVHGPLPQSDRKSSFSQDICRVPQIILPQ